MTTADAAGATVLVLNPDAGRGSTRRRHDEIVEAVSTSGHGRGVGFGRDIVVEMPDGRSACAARLEELTGVAERVIVAGGDGLVHLAVNAFAESSTVLGVIPSGTGNDFADAVGLPSEVGSASAAALEPATAIDGIRVTSPSQGIQWGATVVTLGFSAMVNERAERMSFPRGSSRYSIATLLELPRLAPMDVRIDTGGETQDVRAVLIAVANTSTFGGGMVIAPGADHGDGMLDLVVIGEVSRSTLLRVLPRAFSGKHVEHEAVTMMRASSVEIAGDASRVRADGEALCDTPFRAECVRGALLVAGASVPM